MEPVLTEEQAISQLTDLGFDCEKVKNAFQSASDKTLTGLLAFIEKEQEGLVEEKKEEEKNFQSQTQSISGLVNQTLVTDLQAMGYSKVVSEKSLLLTQNISIQAALDWIEANQGKPDFEEELRLEKQVEDSAPSTLSKEEAAAKAKELQRVLREKRLQREKEEEEEREKNRVKSGKALTQAKRELEEMQIKRDLDAKMREKKADELARQKVLEQLERDKMERFGKKATAITTEKEKPKELSAFEKIQKDITALITAHPNNLYPGAAATAFNTIKLYLENILKNPAEEKFRRINLSNENFCKRVGNLFCGIQILKDCGFEESNGFLFMNKIEEGLLKNTIELLGKCR